MYISSEIPVEYNRIAEISDNYIVLVKEQLLRSGSSYNAYYQFFSPSTEVIFTDNYKITDGNNYTLDYFYTQNQYFTYIDHVDVNYTKNTIELTNISNELFDRHDYWSIGLTVALLLALIILIVNLATSLVHRGGIFHA